MSFAVSSFALQGAGAGASVVGSYFSAKSSKMNLQGQADMLEVNARMLELSARSALDAGQQEVAGLTLKAGQLKGSQRAALAANGGDLGSGNAAEIQASTEMMKEIDKNTVEANAVRRAWGYRTEAVNATNEARMKRTNADSISPAMAAAGTLLSQGGQVASSWYKMNQSGAFNNPSNAGSPDDGSYERKYASGQGR